MWKILIRILIPIYLIGAISWMAIVISTTIIPTNPLGPVISSVFGVDENFVAKPKVVTELKTFDDYMYSDYFYNFLAFSSAIVISGLFTLTKGRNLIEKYILLQAYALPRERDYWGKILDSSTHSPVPFAAIRILLITDNTEKFITESVSDLDGRYRLFLDNNSEQYTLEVRAPGYVTYRGEIKQSIIEGNNAVRINIMLERENIENKLSPIRQFYINHKSKILAILIRYIYFLSIVTFLHAVYSIIFHFNIVSIADMLFYGFSAPWNTFVLWERRKFNPGRFINFRTKQPIANVNVQVFLPGDRTLSLLSDSNGIIKLDVEEGDYKIKVFKPGFIIKDHDDHFITVNVVKDGYMKNNIYLQALNQNSTRDTSLLQSPFGEH